MSSHPVIRESPTLSTRRTRHNNHLTSGARDHRRHANGSDRRRKSPRFEEVIDVEAEDGSPNINNVQYARNNQDRIKRRRDRRRNVGNVEVINLDSDTSPSTTPKGPVNAIGKNRKSNSTNSRESDVEIVEVYSPAAAAARNILQSACASAAYSVLSRKRPLEKPAVDRIREVFPTLSRSKVERLLEMAQKYSQDDDLVQIVMTVLADDPSGESINERVFAAAAVGGKVDPDDNGVSSGAGQKVAQLECNCCFVEYDFEEMVSCKAGHLFCKTCLQKHTETRVFGLGNFGVDASKGKGKAVEILCMHSDGCGAGFNEGHLRRALSEKVMKKYDELQYQAVVEGFKDTSKCPKCDYIAFAEESVSTFHCPQCNFKSCRECGEEAHPGIRCDQVESKHETSGRNKVEEAMTNAVIRKCPRPFCRKPFMKTDGCNKITCSCGAYICYICRKEIPKHVAYKHFCQTPHCNHSSCNKCGLYADADSADKEAMKKAAKEAAKSVSTGRKGVTVDVDALLKNPQPDPPRHQHGQGGRHRPHRNPRPAGIPQQHFPPPPQFHNEPLPNQFHPQHQNPFVLPPPQLYNGPLPNQFHPYQHQNPVVLPPPQFHNGPLPNQFHPHQNQNPFGFQNRGGYNGHGNDGNPYARNHRR